MAKTQFSRETDHFTVSVLVQRVDRTSIDEVDYAGRRVSCKPSQDRSTVDIARITTICDTKEAAMRDARRLLDAVAQSE